MSKSSNNLAKMLRERSTNAERLLWQQLRSKQLEGYKFRRQEPIGRYIVDFVNYEKRIVIELDGGQHAIDKDNDQIRDTWLTVEGFKVLRFWNNEIFENMESVLEIIRKKLLSPSPNPSHQGRGDRDNSTLRGISPSGGDRNKLNRRWESGGYTDPVNPV